MPAPMKNHPTDKTIHIIWNGTHYAIPLIVIEKYKVPSRKQETFSIKEAFTDIIEERGEPGALLKGLRTKENLTQVVFANAINITQANLSAMENGRRPIGKEIAKRIAKKFKLDYRTFL